MKLNENIINDYFCCDADLKIIIDWFQCPNKIKKVIAWEICKDLENNIKKINKTRLSKKKTEINIISETNFLKNEISNLLKNKYHYSNFKPEFSDNIKWLLSSYFCLIENSIDLLKDFLSQIEQPKIQTWTFASFLNNCEIKQEHLQYFKTNFQNEDCKCLSNIVLSKNDDEKKNNIINLIQEGENYKIFKNLCYFCPPVFIPHIIKKLEQNSNLDNYSDQDLWFHYYLIKCIERLKICQYKETFNFEDVCISLLKYVNSLNHVSDHGPWVSVKNKVLSVLEKYTNDIKNLSINNLNNLLNKPNYETILKSFKILETSIGLDSALKSIIKNFNTTYQSYINKDEYLIMTSNALKWLNRKDNRILNKLEDVMNSCSSEEQEMARKLLVEIGGKSAMRRLGTREQLKKKYYETMDTAQNKVNEMFENTMKDAKKGFTVAMTMDCMIFLIGFLLMTVSGFMAVFNNDADNWVGIGASGGTGVMSILFSMFYSKPRQQVKDNVNHMMNLKIIFLAYLRELNQLDQSFSQKMIESDVLTEKDITFFKSKLKESMSEAVNILQLIRKNNEIQSEQTPLISGRSRNSTV